MCPLHPPSHHEQLGWQLQACVLPCLAASCELTMRAFKKLRLALCSRNATMCVGSSMSAHVSAARAHVLGWRTLSRSRSATSVIGRCQHVRICSHAHILEHLEISPMCTMTTCISIPACHHVADGNLLPIMLGQIMQFHVVALHAEILDVRISVNSGKELT